MPIFQASYIGLGVTMQTPTSLAPANGRVPSFNTDGTFAGWVIAGGPAGSGTELQYRSSSTALGAVTGSSWDGTTLTIPNLTVTGTVTTVSTTNLIVTDPLIKLAKDNSANDLIDIGLYGTYVGNGDGFTKYCGLFRDASSSGRFKLFDELREEPTTTVNVSGTGYTDATLLVGSLELSIALLATQASGDNDGLDLTIRKSRGSYSTPTVITTGDQLGAINFHGYSGASGYVNAAQIRAVSEGTIATTRVPSKLVFATGTDAAPTVLTDRLTIDSAGLSTFTGAIVTTGITNSGLTSGRVPFASTGGLEADSANFTWNNGTSTLAITGAVTGTTFNGVALTTGGSATAFLNGAGSYASVPANVSSLNSLTGALTIAVGTSGTDFAVSAASSTVTLNLPDASTTARGVMTTGTQTILGKKTFQASTSEMFLFATQAGTSQGYVTFRDTLNSATRGYFGIGASVLTAASATDFVYRAENTLHLATGDNSRLAINVNGLVGINKSSSIGAQLHVVSSGTTTFSGLFEGANSHSVPPLVVKCGSTPTNHAFEVQNSISTSYVSVGPPTLANSATSNFLNITAALLSSASSSDGRGFMQSLSTSGAGTGAIRGIYSELLVGSTTSSYVIGMQSQVDVAGTATSAAVNQGAANYGFLANAGGTTAGDNVGISGDARNGIRSYGVYGNACTAKNSGTNIGVLGMALNTGSSPIQIGGYFGLQATQPTFASAALMCDNAAQASDIFVARDNGTAVFTIADGGAITATGNIGVADEAYGSSWNGSTNVPTKNAIYDKIQTIASDVLFDHSADSTVGGAEADIYTDTLAASQLANNGEKIVATYGGNFVTLGTESVQLLVKFAGTTIWDSTGIAVSVGTTSWAVAVEIIRVSSTVIRYAVRLSTSGASGFVYCSSGELTSLTLSNTNILKITGASSGVGSGSGDIIGKMGWVEFKPAA